MIRSKDVNKEIRVIEDTVRDSVDPVVIAKAQLKAITLVLKVLRDVRTNQVLRLRKDGIELVKENRLEDEKTSTQQ